MNRPSLILLAIAYLSFISLGLPDAAHGIVWPSMRTTFSLSNSSLGLILAGTGMGYFMSSMLAGKMMDKYGVGFLLAMSSALVSVGLIGFSLSPSWFSIIAFTLFVGVGSGAIDAGLNTYAAENFSTRQMNWMHGSFGIGAMLGPLIVTSILVVGGGWRAGYAVLGIILMCMAVLFVFTRNLWFSSSKSSKEGSQENTEPVAMTLVLRNPIVLFQIALFFFYTGLEVTIGQWAFTVLTEARNVDVGVAGSWTSLYWGSLALGRFVFGAIIHRFGTDRLLRYSMFSAGVGVVLFSIPGVTSGWGLVGLLVLGFSLAPIFPCLVSRTPQRFGKTFAPHVIGFQLSAAMLGVMTLPFLAGFIGQWLGLNAIGLFGLIMVVVMVVLHEIILKSDLKSSKQTMSS